LTTVGHFLQSQTPRSENSWFSKLHPHPSTDTQLFIESLLIVYCISLRIQFQILQYTSTTYRQKYLHKKTKTVSVTYSACVYSTNR